LISLNQNGYNFRMADFSNYLIAVFRIFISYLKNLLMMNLLKLSFFLLAVAFVSSACELNPDVDGDDPEEQERGEPQLDAEISYGNKVITYSLSGEELTDNVVFLSNQVYFEAANELNQTINIKIAAPALYTNTAGVFEAIPALPYAIEDELASIQFYDPTEQPLTNGASKYAIEDEVVVSELSEDKIVVGYDGDAITGAQLNNTDEGRFNLKLELTYTNFQITDMRQ